ncbi:MAG: hypothetical protein JST46_13205 [Bacteroidetes bacterium]|nr:hypothetical protein [Bacteroidota bacterium]
MITVNLGGKERPISMRMIAVKEFNKLTGHNLAGRFNFFDVVGSPDGEKELNPDLFVAFTYCVLKDAAKDSQEEFSLEDVASWIELHDRELGTQLFRLFVESKTGKTLEEALKQEIEKNLQAPESGAQSPGTGLNQQASEPSN